LIAELHGFYCMLRLVASGGFIVAVGAEKTLMIFRKMLDSGFCLMLLCEVDEYV